MPSECDPSDPWSCPDGAPCVCTPDGRCYCGLVGGCDPSDPYACPRGSSCVCDSTGYCECMGWDGGDAGTRDGGTPVPVDAG